MSSSPPTATGRDRFQSTRFNSIYNEQSLPLTGILNYIPSICSSYDWHPKHEKEVVAPQVHDRLIDAIGTDQILFVCKISFLENLLV